MKKGTRIHNPNKTPVKITTKPTPAFHQINQIMNDGTVKPLFKKPVFCTQEIGLELGIKNCTIEGNLITIQVKRLTPDQQAAMLLESTELDLLKYTKAK